MWSDSSLRMARFSFPRGERVARRTFYFCLAARLCDFLAAFLTGSFLDHELSAFNGLRSREEFSP